MADETKPTTPAAPATATPANTDAASGTTPPVNAAGGTESPVKVETPTKANADPAAQSAAGATELVAPKDMQVDQAVFEKFKEIAKDKSFTPQKALDFYTSTLKESEAVKAKQFEAWQASQVESLKTDPDFGKNYDANVELARKALTEHGGADLVKELDSMGLGNHAGIIKFARKFGQAISEDSTRTAQPANAQTTSYEQTLQQRYPSMYNADGTAK